MLYQFDDNYAFGGLWHGASWNFVVWGGIHGVALVLDKILLRLKIMQTKVMKVISVIVTFNFVCFGWIFFSSPDFARAGIMLNRIFTAFNGQIFGQWLEQYRICAHPNFNRFVFSLDAPKL